MKRLVIFVLLLVISMPFSYAKIVEIPEVEEVSEPLRQENIKKYVYAGSSIVASIESNEIKYYHQDRLSNRVVTDSSGNKTGEFLSLPFGQEMIKENVDYPFTGKEKDESGLHYFGARYYDSNLGRFISVDSVPSEPAYQYVGNNPMNMVDPTGSIPMSFMAGGPGSFMNSRDLGSMAAGELTFGASDAFSAIKGKDYISGDELGGLDRTLMMAGAIAPFIPGRAFRGVGRFFRGLMDTMPKLKSRQIANYFTRGGTEVPLGLNDPKLKDKIHEAVAHIQARTGIGPDSSMLADPAKRDEVYRALIEYTDANVESSVRGIGSGAYAAGRDQILSSGGTLADVVDQGQAVCRELSCFGHVVLNEMGLATEVVTGNVRGGGHAWLVTRGGSRVIDFNNVRGVMTPDMYAQRVSATEISRQTLVTR